MLDEYAKPKVGKKPKNEVFIFEVRLPFSAAGVDVCRGSECASREWMCAAGVDVPTRGV